MNHAMNGRMRYILAGAATLTIVPIAIPTAGATNDNQYVKTGLVTLCSTDGFVRVGGLNDSSRDVTISLVERDADGKPVNVLGSNASDELKAIFPITIPADSKYVVTWDLPYPAHYGGVVKGSDHQMHGSWNPAKWVDENGLNYRGTGGTAGKNGPTCSPTTPPSTTPPTTTPPSTTPPTTTPPSTVPPSTVPPSTVPPSTVPPSTVPPSTTTATTLPAEVVEPIKAVGAFSTSNSQLGALAFDGDPATSFVTQMLPGQPATWAWDRADLGKEVALRRVEWELSADSAADDFRVQVSIDAKTWTTVATATDGKAGATNVAEVSTEARFVRFYWRNPNLDDQLGHLAEARFFAVPTDEAQVARRAPGAPVAPSTMPPAPKVISTTVSPLGERILVKTSSRSSNSPVGASRLPLDGNGSTAYATSMSVAPWTGWASYDFGSETSLGRVRWKFNTIGMADYYRIQVSNDATTWTSLATLGNAVNADEWQTLMTDVDARYVRFLFINVNGDANVGGLSEVRFYAS
jgi:F5/8 type C domain